MSKFRFYIMFVIMLSNAIQLWTQTSILELNKTLNNYTLDFIIWENNQLVQSINTNEISLKFNNSNKLYSIASSSVSIENKLKSIIISLDISNSFDNNNFNLSKNGITTLLDNLNYLKPEIALTTFNTNSYLNQDFTTDFNKIKQALPYISLFGGTNIENSFFSNIAGAETVFRNAKYDENIIIIADSYNELNTNKIKDYLQNKNVNCYLIYFGDVIPKTIYNLALATNNFKYLLCNSNQKSLNIALDKIITSMYNIKPFQISFNGTVCEDSLNICLSYKNKLDSLKFKTLSNWKNNYKFSNYSLVSIGEIEQLIPKDTIISFYSEYDSITIQSINTNSPKVKYQILDSVSYADHSAKVKFTYTPTDTSYFKTSLVIQNSGCSNLIFSLDAGRKNNYNNNSSIFINQPRINDNLIANANYVIKWDGTNPKDTFKIEYSIDDGNQWIAITNKATSNSFNWLVPNISSPCKIRISELANNNLLENVTYYNFNNSYADNISGGDNYNFAVSTNKGALYLIKPFFQNIATVISSDLKKINALKFAKSGTKIATSIDAVTSNSNLILFDTDDTQPPIKLLGNLEKVKSIDWNLQSTILAAGEINGNLDIWNINSPNSPTYSFPQRHNGIINTLVWCNNNNLIITGGSDKWVKFTSTNTWLPQKDSINLGVGANDEIISMKLIENEKRLLVITKNNALFVVDLFKNDTLLFPDPKYNLNITNSTNNNIGNYLTKSIYNSNNNAEIIDNNGIPIYKYKGHNALISCLEVNNSGIVASADINGSIQFWNIKDTVFEKKVLEIKTSGNFNIIKPNLTVIDANLGNYCLGKVLTSKIDKYITNTTNANITIDSIVITNDLFKEFKIENVLPLVIKSNSSLDLQISFEPTIESSKFVTITVYSGNYKISKLLTAVGYDPKYEVNNNFIDFGKVNFDDSKSLQGKLKITNSGKLDLKILNYEFQSKEQIFTLLQNGLPVAIPLVITPNLTEIFDVIFKPIALERYNTLLKFNTQEFCTPIFVNLYGIGVAPDLGSTIVKLNTITCSTQSIDTTIALKNNGSGLLKVNSIKQISGNSNCEAFLLNNSANFDDTIFIKVKYKDSGIHSDTNLFVLETNRLYNNSNSYSFTVISKKDSLGISLSEPMLNFIAQERNKTYSNTISIINNGNTIIDWSKTKYDAKYFHLVNIKPVICPSGQSSIFEFEFKGSNIDTIIQDIFNINTICSNLNLPLLAYIGNKETTISYTDKYNLGIINCNEFKEFSIVLKNTGNNNLLVDKIDFSNNNLFLLTTLPKVVSPDSSITISFKYLTNSLKETLNILIHTNANNVLNGKLNITIDYDLISNKFVKSKDTLELNDYTINTKNKFTYSTKYIGNNNLVISTPVQIANNITLDSISPAIITPNSDVVFYFTLNALTEGKLASYYSFINNCEDSLYLAINAVVNSTKYIKFNLPVIDANIGDQVTLKTTLTNPFQVNLSFLDNAVIEFKYNSTILIPKFQFISDTIITNIRFTKAIYSYLKSYNFITTLGDSNLSNVEFDITPIINPDLISIITDTGKVVLKDICYEGSPRYVVNTGVFKFSTPYPNPSESYINVDINAIEKGNYALDLYDEMGNLIKNLFNKELLPNPYIIKISTLDIPIGGYYCKLSTPSEFYFRKLIIIR